MTYFADSWCHMDLHPLAQVTNTQKDKYSVASLKVMHTYFSWAGYIILNFEGHSMLSYGAVIIHVMLREECAWCSQEALYIFVWFTVHTYSVECIKFTILRWLWLFWSGDLCWQLGVVGHQQIELKGKNYSNWDI